MDTLSTEIFQDGGQFADAESRQQMFLTIMYLSGALLLLFTAYILFLKRFKRAKLLAVNNISLVTSRQDIYSDATEFLIVSPVIEEIRLLLLDENEVELAELFNAEIATGEQVVFFNAQDYKAGIYYLSLKSKSANILRKIKIISKD